MKANLLFVGSAVADNASGAQCQNRLLLKAADDLNALHRDADDICRLPHRILNDDGCFAHAIVLIFNATDNQFELLSEYEKNGALELLYVPFSNSGEVSLLVCLAYLMMKSSKASFMVDLRSLHEESLAFCNSRPDPAVFGELPISARMRECCRRQEILERACNGGLTAATGATAPPDFMAVMEERYIAACASALGKAREYFIDIPAAKCGAVFAYLGDAVLGPIVAEEVLRVLPGV
ncbi:hypothetical protein B484DRAFT_410716, partial [Ochromonadaceae sp. CCMP2298]